MLGQVAMRDVCTLVVAGYQIDGHAVIRNSFQRIECHRHQAGGDFAAVKDIAAMHDAVDAILQGGLQSAFEIRKKLRSPAPALNSRPQGKIQSQVGVGQKQQADHTHCNTFCSW